jgi:hypothetical protein
MAANNTLPTPYPDVNALFRRLLSDVQSVLGDHFVGLYILGSLATGGFDPQRSDIDFLVVTADELPREILPALAAMHERINASDLALPTPMEGSYIPRQALRRYDPTQADHPALRVDGSFGVDHHSSDWIIQRHVIREQAVVVAGPASRTLVDPVQPNDVRRAALGILREWWAPQLTESFRLISSEYQAYAVMTMCRAFYTLQQGTVVPKSTAARWAYAELGQRWTMLIDRALAWQRGLEMESFDETLDFIRYTLERAEQFKMPPE